jgi:hypothetical protein
LAISFGPFGTIKVVIKKKRAASHPTDRHCGPPHLTIPYRGLGQNRPGPLQASIRI